MSNSTEYRVKLSKSQMQRLTGLAGKVEIRTERRQGPVVQRKEPVPPAPLTLETGPWGAKMYQGKR
ncbi:hypothetical protein [Niveispirillum fermenti]|uniref:hypothetical protein n=1 Tax=Niveispirillum fermenti TaxID=1233113 RepID=UPI003A880CA5